MYRTLTEIKNYEEKKKKVISALAQLKQNGVDENQNIKNICFSIGIDETEVDDMIQYLKIGQVIETGADNSTGKLTMYGELLNRGEISTGYAPL